MVKRSNPSSSDTETNTSAANICIWNEQMDDVLIDSFYHEHTLGNRVGGTFTTHAIDNVVKEMQTKFPTKSITKEKIHNRVKIIKKLFSKCYDTFQNGMSGFAWDPSTHKWSAEPEVWDQLIQAKPEAAEWRNKPIRNYEKLVLLYGKDRATGKHAETGQDMLRRGARDNLRRSNSVPITIDEIDEMISMNAASLETPSKYVQEDQEQPTPEAPRSHEEVPIGNKSKRSKHDHLEDMAAMLKGGMDHLANAINRLSNMPPIPENEIWEMVKEMGLEPSVTRRAYIFLCRNADLCRTLIGYPWEERKDLLLTMMPTDN